MRHGGYFSSPPGATGDDVAKDLSGENSMLDTLMLVFGAGMFVLMLGYVAVCDKI